VGSYASNEICINWNAPLVFVSGYLNESPLVTVGGEKLDLPQRLELQQNYPNPFNPKTVISSQLSVASNVRLVIYDMLGQEVAVLVNERREAGRYQDTFDGSGLASGMYIYRLSVGGFVEARTMLLLR
jgi:hypothetical protein